MNQFKRRQLFALLAVSTLVLPAGVNLAQAQTAIKTPPPTFSAIDIGGLTDEGVSRAYGINGNGQAVGYGVDKNGRRRAVLFDPNQHDSRLALRDLGTLAKVKATTSTATGTSVPATNANGDTPPTVPISTLATDPQDESIAFGVNSAGQVVGVAATGAGDVSRHAFVWEELVGINDIGTLPGNARSAARAINESGIVVGWSGDGPQRGAFRYNTETQKMEPLGIPDRNYWCQAFAVNDGGQIVGEADPFDRRIRPQIELQPADGRDPEAESSIRPLSTLGTTRNIVSKATGSRIELVGRVARSPQGFWWSPGKPKADDKSRVRLDSQLANGTYGSLGTLGGAYTGGFAISDNGWVAGNSRPGGSQATHAFVWNLHSRNNLSDLGTLGGATSGAWGVDRSGTVVGWAMTGNNERHAFYARRNPDTGRWEMRDLNSLLIPRDQDEWTLTEARGINDKGQIVGWGKHRVVLPGRAILFVERGFVLTPLPL